MGLQQGVEALQSAMGVDREGHSPAVIKPALQALGGGLQAALADGEIAVVSCSGRVGLAMGATVGAGARSCEKFAASGPSKRSWGTTRGGLRHRAGPSALSTAGRSDRGRRLHLVLDGKHPAGPQIGEPRGERHERVQRAGYPPPGNHSPCLRSARSLWRTCRCAPVDHRQGVLTGTLQAVRTPRPRARAKQLRIDGLLATGWASMRAMLDFIVENPMRNGWGGRRAGRRRRYRGGRPCRAPRAVP